MGQWQTPLQELSSDNKGKHVDQTNDSCITLMLSGPQSHKLGSGCGGEIRRPFVDHHRPACSRSPCSLPSPSRDGDHRRKEWVKITINGN